MSKARIRQIETQIERIKEQLQEIAEMRPGSLTRQYRVPKEKIGPYYQLSYMHKMKRVCLISQEHIMRRICRLSGIGDRARCRCSRTRNRASPR